MAHEADERELESLAAILADYLTRIDRGEPISPETMLANHPAHAAALRDYFADADLIEQLCRDPAAAAALAHPTLPRVFGEFELESEIDRGGMGVVYRARERSTGRLVALKMLLHALFPSPSEVLRFRHEATTAAKLSHPGIVPIYHASEHDGHLFYTMPLVEGTDLAKRLADGQLEPTAAAQLLLAIAEAVAFAHRSGVVHRDLKPANILLDAAGLPHVTDFGLARRLGEEPLGLTATGDLVGTPNYMAPEQVSGGRALIGPATDVYALGAILYAMLLGQPPFKSENVPATLQKIGSEEPVRPRQLNRNVPRDLETICLKCLEKSSVNRYPSAVELADDLRRFLAGEPVHARPVSTFERSRRWFVRNPVVGSLTVGIVLALVAGIVFSTHYALQARERARQALANERQALVSERQALANERQARINLYAADMNLAQQHVRSGAVASALALLEKHLPQPSSHNTGNHQGASTPDMPWEWRHLWHQCHGELRRFDGPQGPVYAAAFSPDGRTVAAAGADKTVWLWETATGKVKYKLAGHTATIRDLAFSPDGQRLVTVGDDSRGIVWDAATGARLATLVATGGSHVNASPPVDVDTRSAFPTPNTGEPPDALNVQTESLTAVAFSADGKLIATGGKDEPMVTLWNAATGELNQSLDIGPVESLAFAPDSARLAVAGRDGKVRVCRLQGSGTWTAADTVPAHANVIHNVAWSPDGTHLATAAADRTVKVWLANSWQQLAEIKSSRESVYSIDFSPDGGRLAMAARNEPLRVWDFARQEFVADLIGHTALATCVDFCPAGWRLVSASEDGSVRLWNAAQSGDHDQLAGHDGKVRAVAYSPDGKLFATGGANEATVLLWDIETSQPLRVLHVWPAGIKDVEFSYDGQYLAVAMLGGHLRIWHVRTGREVIALSDLSNDDLASVAWSPDSKRIAVRALDGTIIILLNAGTGRTLAKRSAPKGPSATVAFRADGHWLVTGGGDNAVRVWNVDTLSPVHELVGHTAPVVNAIFDPSGALIASSSNDHTVRLWDATTGQHLRTLTGHNGTPYGLAFSPDGTRLASSSTDQTIKIWDVATGLELQTLTGNKDWVRDIAFSPDGQHLASAGYDGTVRVWHAPSQAADSSAAHAPTHAADLSAAREAAALVRQLAHQLADREKVLAVIAADASISGESVRTAATQQAEDCLYYWSPMLAGHRAAERGDWPAAADAFERATALAPSEVMLRRWSAFASYAAGRKEAYTRACEEMLTRCGPSSTAAAVTETLETCLLLPTTNQIYERLKPLMAVAPKHIQPDEKLFAWLYDLRTGATPREFLSVPGPPLVLDPPAGALIQALAWHRAGNASQARAAYATAMSRRRAVSMNYWIGRLHFDVLQREVEALLAAEPAATTASPPGPSAAGDSR